ncbi:MAG TPA: glycosyltransferase family A protein [Pseudolabrys sp.]|nr:glycosyltransferase family A protein [Pseudolabrys sp.]
MSDVDNIDSRTGPLVSVVVPVFNGEKVVSRALRSVQAQTYADFEVVVVDDGSTDQTAARIAEIADGRFNCIRHPRNRGAAAARNTGVAAARGRWIAFLDCDDTWAADKLARQIESLKSSGAAACASGYRLHKNGRERLFDVKLTSRQFRREILFGCTISPGSTLVVDRGVFADIGMFDESLPRLEDWDWLLRFSKRYDMTFVPAPLADVYVQPRSHRQDVAEVTGALDRIRRKHVPRASLRTGLRLRSSILVEKAGMHYRAGRPLAAAGYVIAALFVYPFRNLAFFRMLWRSVKRSAAPRSEDQPHLVSGKLELTASEHERA